MGPQVLELSYDGPSPTVSRSVLQSLIRQLGVGSRFGDTIGKTASEYYRTQIASATSTWVSNQGSLATYAVSHPGSTAANDPTFRALALEVRLAQAQRASVQSESNTANAEASSGGDATMQVIDPPSLPEAPATGLGSKLMGVFGGLFAGAMVSVLALLALTPRAPIPWDAEVPLFARLAARDKIQRYIGGRPARQAAVRAASPRRALPRRDLPSRQSHV